MEATSRFAKQVRGHAAFVVAWALCDVVLLSWGGWPALLAGAMLYGYLPGVLLCCALLGAGRPTSLVERAALSASGAYVVSTLVMLVLHFVPGPLTLAHALVGLNAAPAVLFLLAVRHPLPPTLPESRPRPAWTEVALIVAVIAITLASRFISLGYSEYQGDEIDVTRLAALSIAGQDDAPFLHRKGPAELLIAAAFALFHRDFNELVLRFPFALASAWSVVAAYALGRRVLGPRTAALGAVLLATNGIFLGFSRMVQYQGVVALMIAGAVLCFLLLRQDRGNGYCIAGLSLWGFGMLSHYEAALAGLPILILYLNASRAEPSRGRLRVALLTLAAMTAILLAYYVPFVTHPHFADTFRRYTQIRISLDRAPFNNLDDYLGSSLFYNSLYYELVMLGGLLVAAFSALRSAVKPANASALWLAFAVGLVGSALAPGWLEIGGLRLGLILVLPAALALVLTPGVAAGPRALFAWFCVYLIAYAFLIRTPGLHYYTLVPAWALLAAWGWSEAARRLRGSALIWPAGAVAVVVGALVLYYPVLLFLRASDEYALTYPSKRNPLYPNASTGLPDRFFGLPHRSGWKAAGLLYAEGTLNGTYRSNEKAEITGWYVGTPPSAQERPDYYLIADNATEKPREQDYPVDLLRSEYALAGRIARDGQPCISIYRRGPGDELGLIEDRTLAPEFDRLVGLDRHVAGDAPPAAAGSVDAPRGATP